MASRATVSLAVLGLLGCRASEENAARVGIDATLEEVGLGPWLEAAYEASPERRADLRYLVPPKLVSAVRAGQLDAVVVASPEARETLETEGLVSASEVIAHEELVLIGPRENFLGKYAHSRGAELLKNVARTNAKYLKPAPGSLEGLRHRALFRATGDHVEPGSWFPTNLSGRALVRAAVERDAFALVLRSSLLLAAREGRMPGRIWDEGDPALTVELVSGAVHPAKAGRELGAGFHAWLSGPDGQAALETFGADRLGHPLYALGAPSPGEGASTAPLDAWVRTRSEE